LHFVGHVKEQQKLAESQQTGENMASGWVRKVTFCVVIFQCHHSVIKFCVTWKFLLFQFEVIFVFLRFQPIQGGSKLGEGERERDLITLLEELCKEHDRETARQAIETMLKIAK